MKSYKKKRQCNYGKNELKHLKIKQETKRQRQENKGE